MQLKDADKWAVVDWDGEVLVVSDRDKPAAYIAANGMPGRTVVPCRLVPVADLDRLVEAVNAVIVADAEDPLVDLTRALIASLDAAIAPFMPLGMVTGSIVAAA